LFVVSKMMIDGFAVLSKLAAALLSSFCFAAAASAVSAATS